MRKLTILFIFLWSLPMAIMAEEQTTTPEPVAPTPAPEVVQPAPAEVIAPQAAPKAIIPAEAPKATAPATPPPAYLQGYQPYQGAGGQVKK
jgi:hypothetical protein